MVRNIPDPEVFRKHSENIVSGASRPVSDLVQWRNNEIKDRKSVKSD